MAYMNRHYKQTIMSFDIETTSYVQYKDVFHRDGTVTEEVDRKYAWMYLADFCTYIAGTYSHHTVRNWKDVVAYLDRLSDFCAKGWYYVIWVHNLSFEFQFMKDWMKLTDVFCRKSHNVLKCTYRNIEFRDTLALANCKLEKLAKNENLPVQKAVGDLDYSLVRCPMTPVTDTEINYQWKDTEVVCAYIAKKKKEYKKLENIPTTSTGEVRYLFIEELEKSKSLKKIHSLVQLYSAQTIELQNLLISIYAGAYTHCNYQYIDQTLHNLKCRDIASSYPYQMVARKYPTIWFQLDFEVNTKEDLKKLAEEYPPEEYAWACYATFTKIRAKHCHNILSLHKAKKISEDNIIDNGRIVSASYLEFDINEIDLANICDFYNIEKITLTDIHVSKKEYLPKELVAVILKLFQQKTSLKGVEGQEENYMRSKNRINGVYGSAVFNLLNSGIYFDEISNMKFLKEEKTFADYKKYIGNPKQYLWYAIGVWVTSYARRQILKPIKHMSENAVYCDTDSVKYLGWKKYDRYWDVVNNNIKDEFLKAMNYHGFTEDEYRFFDKDGKEYFMGIFEEEPYYRTFKSLGSKRYIAEHFDKKKDKWVVETTVAGAPKNMADALGKTTEEKFKNFKNNFILKDSRLTHTYVEGRRNLIVIDYLGESHIVDTRSGVCLTSADFSMCLSDDFFNFLYGRIEFEDKNIYDYFFGQEKYEK